MYIYLYRYYVDMKENELTSMRLEKRQPKKINEETLCCAIQDAGGKVFDQFAPSSSWCAVG